MPALSKQAMLAKCLTLVAEAAPSATAKQRERIALAYANDYDLNLRPMNYEIPTWEVLASLRSIVLTKPETVRPVPSRASVKARLLNDVTDPQQRMLRSRQIDTFSDDELVAAFDDAKEPPQEQPEQEAAKSSPPVVGVLSDNEVLAMIKESIGPARYDAMGPGARLEHVRYFGANVLPPAPAPTPATNEIALRVRLDKNFVASPQDRISVHREAQAAALASGKK